MSEATTPTESRREKLHRHAHRARLYGWATGLVVALLLVVALVVANTRQVRVSWVVGHSHTSVVWLIVVPAVIGWFAGIATSVVFRHRTRVARPLGP